MATEKIVIFNEDERGIARSWSEVGEIVRCKDCKYKGWSFVKGEMKLVCDNENGLFRDVQMNDFCSRAERSKE